MTQSPPSPPPPSTDPPSADAAPGERAARLRAREERLRARADRLSARDERLKARDERLAAQDELDEARLLAAISEAQAEEQAALAREQARLAGEETRPGGGGKARRAEAPESPLVAALPPAARTRLAAFPPSRVAEIAALAAPSGAAPDDTSWWPELAGCLVILFTARSGSTFVSRELEARFNLGRVGESLNPAQLRVRPIGALLAPRSGAWFGCKAGVQGIVSGEIARFFETYLDRCVFVQLVRRDIVAQAVSLDRAERTGGWHEKAEDGEELPYDGERIARAINIITGRVSALRAWAEMTGRPRRAIVYETVAHGDFSPALAACEDLGAPRRAAGEAAELRAVERMSDELNTRWQARFEAEMDASMRQQIEHYLATL